MKTLVKNCPTHGLTTWMVIHTFYAGLNFTSRNLLDSAVGGTFMSTTLGAATKLLEEMMLNYSQWHTERSPTGKKGVFKCAMESDERRSWSVKRSSLGMPPCTPNKYSRSLKCLSLGMPPCIPFFIYNYQFVPRCTIFLSLHALCAMLGASRSLLFLVCFSFVCCSNKLDPNFLFCVGEKHAPLELELLIGFACLFF